MLGKTTVSKACYSWTVVNMILRRTMFFFLTYFSENIKFCKIQNHLKRKLKTAEKHPIMW